MLLVCIHYCLLGGRIFQNRNIVFQTLWYGSINNLCSLVLHWFAKHLAESVHEGRVLCKKWVFVFNILKNTFCQCLWARRVMTFMLVYADNGNENVHFALQNMKLAKSIFLHTFCSHTTARLDSRRCKKVEN